MLDTIANLFIENLDVVYFVYGLAFFSMGLALFLESGRASQFRLARAMGSLAGFGVLHGIHEWLEMFIRLGKFSRLDGEQQFLFEGLRIWLLLTSFLLLVVFGIRLIYSNRHHSGNEHSFALMVAGILGIYWLGSVWLTWWVYAPSATELVRGADVLARYIAGIPGALLAAWAIVLEQRAFEARGMPDFGRALRWAALAMILYGVVGQIFTTPSLLFPASVINADVFIQIFHFPVQLFRAVMATIMSLFVIRALRVFEWESQQQLAAAHEARLAAQTAVLQTQAQALAAQNQAQQEMELLNRQLQTAVQDQIVLFELSRHLSATLDKKTLLQETMGQMLLSMPRMRGGLILLRQGPGKTAELVAQAGYQPETQRTLPGCIFDRAYQLGLYVVEQGVVTLCTGTDIIPIGTASDWHAWQDQHRLPTNGRTVGIPLIIRAQIAGSLVISNNNDIPINDRDLFLVITMARQLSIALENATLYAEVQAREALRGELLHQVVSAQEKERQRVARELHDGTGQTLTALGLGLAAVSEMLRIRPERAAEQLSELQVMSTQALEEIRDMIADLRPSMLDNLGLVPALRSQVQAFERRTGIQATFTITGDRRRVHADTETVIFRIAQEALTNIAKHAAASRVRLRLIFREDRLCLWVRDNGRGFDMETTLTPDAKKRIAWGLLGMKERVALVGGSHFIRSKPGAGTTIQICIPLTSNRGE